MAPRPYWKGYLKLSLVSCPVQLFPASTNVEKTHFHQINRKTKRRLRQQMVDEETGQLVGGEQKGRGYEVTKGSYVEIDEDEIKAIEVESTHTIDIDSFVPKKDIDERYRDKPYYVVPDGKTGADAFAVIRDAMKGKDRVALARIVMANREHVLAIEPMGKGMLATTLRYPYQVRDASEYFDDVETPKVTREMVALAEHILASKEGKFDPAKFKDEYETALKALIKRKAAGETIEAAEEPAPSHNVIDLMEALKGSLKSKPGGAPAKTTRGKTHSTPPRTAKTRRHRAA
jgi:DNA end-binding protein Ku